MQNKLSSLFALLIGLVAPMSGYSQPLLVGDEPLPAGVRFVPSSHVAFRDEANVVGDRTVAGTTWYDYQANGTIGKQIALDDEGDVHLVWMKSVQDFAAGERHCYYNYLINEEPQFDGGVNVDGLARGGYCNISYGSSFGAAPLYHANRDDGLTWTHWAKDEELGEGAFTTVVAARGGNDMYIWPKGAVDRNGRVHVLMRHRDEDPNAYSTTLLYSNGIEGENDWEFSEPRVVGTLKQISYAVAASPVSDKVALIFPSHAYPDGENPRFAGTAGAPAANNDLLVFESENGVDFDWDNPINVTRILRPNPDADQNSPFYQGDTLRPVLFVDGCYDTNDNLHLVFSSVSFWEMVDPNANPGYDGAKYDEKRNMLWHWDRETDVISLVASGRYTTDGNVGTWRQNLSFPSLGIAEDQTVYCAWTQFLMQGDRAANGYVGGEIFANCSQDGGLTWSVPVNLTDTHADNAQAGQAQSECWSSLAARVDDYLHISYVFDFDAGAVVQAEGQVTENNFIYHRVARDDIPTQPLQAGRDFHVGLPPSVEVDDDVIELVAVPGGDAGVADLHISNTADNSTGLWYSLTAPDEMVDLISFEPGAGRLPAGGEANVIVRFAPDEQGEFNGNLLLYHNAPNQNSPIEVRYHALAAAGFGSLHGVVTDLSNGAGIEGAEVRLTPGGYRAVSNADGEYQFERVPAWNYHVTVEHPDFLLGESETELQVDQASALDIRLKFGTFDIADQALEVSVSVDEELETGIRIQNNGNGLVNYTSGLVFPGGELEPYSERQYFPAAQIVGDNRLNGVAFADDHFYVTGGNNGRGRGLVYQFSSDGEATASFSEYMDSPFGMRDIAWDGEHLYGGDGRSIFEFDTDGNLVQTINGPINPCRSMAWDPDRNVLWVCDVRSNIFSINKEGQEQSHFRQLDTTRIYGLAYYPQDPDGFSLYAVSSTASHPNHLYKINPENGQFRVVADLPVRANDVAGGIEITSDYDPYNFVIVECLAGNPDGVAVYQLDTRTNWVSLSPESGVVEPNQPITATLTFDSHGLPIEQRFETTAHFEHTGRGQAVDVPIAMTVTEEGGLTHRSIMFDLGWNDISLNIEPETANIATLTRPLLDAGLLMMVKDDQGRFYRPDQNFNNLNDWLPAKGYQFKLSGAGRLDVEGLGIAYNHPIDLRSGWQLVSYFPRAATEVTTTLAGIAEALVVVKDGAGHFYLPAHDFTNMDPMREGRGYFMKVNADVQLEYQLGRAAGFEYCARPTHFAEPASTGENMSVLVEKLPAEILEVAAKSATGQIVGSGIVDPAGRCGLAVWGNDGEGLGLAKNEEFKLVGWDGKHELEVEADWTSGSNAFELNGISIGSALNGGSIPDKFALFDPYPNPFNSTSKIRFDLPNQGMVQIALYDANGRELKQLVKQVYQAGRHTFTLNGSDLPSGIYLCKIASGNYRASVKAVLIR